MAKTIRFHLDENVSNAIAEGLRRRGIDVTTTPETDLMGVSDQEQINFATEQKRVIFTQDADFLRIARTGIPHHGIIYGQQKSHSIGDIIRSLTLIWEYLDPEEMQSKVEFI